MRTRLVMLGALLMPAIALSQPYPDPAQPPPPPPAPEAPQTPQTPSTTHNTQAPSVVVNPPPPPPPVQVAPPMVSIAPVEPEYEEVVYDSYNAPLLTTGALVFGATYGASVIVASTTDEDDDRGNRRLFVPVVGPWLALSDRGECDITNSACDNETTAKVLLIADGVFQAAGVVAMVGGVLRPTSRRVVTRHAKLDTKVHVRPTVVNGPGVTVFGRF